MSFLRRARAKTLTSVEEVAVSKLHEAYSNVTTACGSAGESWDLQSPEGAAACTELLQEIDAASRSMRVPMAARDYRENFTINYQVLFPGDDRHYRLDILTACTEQYSGIWLNGQRYNFGEEVTTKAEALMLAWTELLKFLGSWQLESKQQDKSELKTSLRTFDESWSQFEHGYIMGLMQIEDNAKKLLRDAIQQEGTLQALESNVIDSNCGELLVERSKFVQCISELNTVANTERKGRGDLSADILCHALKLWRGHEGRESQSLVELRATQTEGKPCSGESFGNVESTITSNSTTSTTSSLGGLKNKFCGILKSVTNSTKSAHTSSKAVRFFPEGEQEDDDVGVDDVSDASTSCTEKHHSSADLVRDVIGKHWEDSEVHSLDDILRSELHSADPHSELSDESAEDKSAAQCLAGDVVESYWHIRYYLRDIANSLERIDPNLSNNSELVSRLEDWEEHWEVGRDYVLDAEMLKIVCELVSFLKEAEILEPAFAVMTQECGAEFCLSLPRLVWLHFLQDPQRHMKLLQRFLPHHFAPSNENSQPSWDDSICDLLCQYREAEREVAQLSRRVADKRCSVHRFLVQSVIAGPNSESQPDFSTEMDLAPDSDSSALVHAIEERSIELQRHQPEAWNHFMMVIVRCFSQGQPKPRQRMGPKAPVPKMQPARGRRSLWRNRPRLRTMPFPEAIACLAQRP